jgi:two-component system chemotaxis response regulator CheY
MPAASKLSVVIVDDQMTIRSLVRTGLNQIAINEVREFGVAEDALKHIKGHAPNVVISDFDMPGMNGLELLKGIRADMKLKNTAFILLTARADKDLVQRAVQLGANNFLVKPFTIAALKQKIEQVVGALT